MSRLDHYNPSMLNTLSNSHRCTKKINQTIEKAQEEIKKERELLEKKRPDTPSKTLIDYYSQSDEDNEGSVSAEDEMLNLLDQISTDIRIKEELVTQLQTTQSEYYSMKETYEEKLRMMADQVHIVQKERDQAFRKVDTSSDKDKTQFNALKTRYEERLRKINSEMGDLRKKYENVQRDILNKRQTNESLISSMKVHVESLKKEKLKLLKRVKDKETSALQREQEREREMNNLRRREKQSADLAKQLERQSRTHKLMLKKRTEENVQAQSKLRSVMA
eukprot:Partr_v1_DN28806_c2_g1_i3_m34066